MPPEGRKLAVALHDVEPATYERCVALRDWLAERGVARATLLVIPARDLHPVGERSPELTGWLRERRHCGDSIAQHGFQHEQLRSPSRANRIFAPMRARRAAEFAGLDELETRRAVEAGWRLLKLAGIEPDGFVAPGYAYTTALRRALDTRFRWWASLLGVHSGGLLTSGGSLGGGLLTSHGDSLSGGLLASHGGRLGSATRTGRGLTPAWGPRSLRAGARLAKDTLRLDLAPAQLQHPYQLRQLERALAGVARQRTAVTYDELASTPLHAENTGASSELRPRVAA